MFTAALATLPPWEIIRYCLQATQEHPPLFYLVLHGWMLAAGDSDVALRMAAIAPSTLAVPLVGIAAALAAGTPAGAVAAWALALAPLDVFYGRYGRMYGVLTLYMAMLLAGAGLLSRPRTRTLGGLLCGSAVALTVLTHYFLAFVVAIPAVVLALQRGAWRSVLVAGTASSVFLGVWLLSSAGLRDTIAARIALRAVEPQALGNTLLLAFGAVAWPFGPIEFGAVFVAVAVAIALWRGRVRRNAVWWTAVAAFALSAVATPGLSLLGVLFLPRYVVVGLPATAVLVGLAVSGRGRRVAIPLAAIALGFGFWQGVVPGFAHKAGDYPDAVGVVREQAKPGDAVVLNGPAQMFWYRRYGPDLPEGQVLVRPSSESESDRLSALVEARPLDDRLALPRLADLAARHPRLWVMESAANYFDPQGTVLRWVEANAYPVSVRRFASVAVRLYLTAGERPLPESRLVGTSLLDVRIESVDLDDWTLEVGADARLLVRGQAANDAGPRKFSVRLVPEDGGKAVWEQDGPFLRSAGVEQDGPFLRSAGVDVEARAGVTLPPAVAPGDYRLNLVVYEANHQGVVRSSEPLEVGLVRIVPSQS